MRAIWSGSISFGLINIPVKLYSASKENALRFKLLDKHGLCPISYARVCRTDNREVKYEDIVKGYEYQKGDYVVLTDEDFQKADVRKTRTIEIVNFVEETEIDPKFFEKPYYIEPDKKAEKAYVLLREALKRSKKVGLARFVLKDREHMATIKAEDKALVLTQLRFQDEIRDPEGLHFPGKEGYSKKEMDIALMLIDQLTDHFEAEEYRDSYTEELKRIIAQKAKGKTPKKIGREPVTTSMKDLMSMLKKSLEKEQKRKKPGERTKVKA